MKKILSLVLAFAMSLGIVALTGCIVNNPKDEKTKITFVMPDGAPALAAYELLKNVDTLDGHPVEYKILAGASELGPMLIKGEAQVAVMPLNVAAKLYNNNVDIKLLSVNIFGNLYMIGKTEPEGGAKGLLGKVVLNIGRGGTPDITLKLILDRNNLKYEESETPVEGKVAIRYCQDAAEVISLLKTGRADFGVVGEPAATKAVAAIGGMVAIDMQSVWNELVGENSFTQAGVVVSKAVYSDNGLIDALFEKLTSNLTYIYQDADNVSATMSEKGSSLKVNFNEGVLNRCNLKNVKAKTIKEQIKSYFEAVKGYDASFIGGKLPEDGFYL